VAICQPPGYGNKGHLAARTFNFIGVNFTPKQGTITDYVEDQGRNQGARDSMMTFALNANGDGHNITFKTLYVAAGRHILQKMNIEQSVTLRRIDLFQKTAEDTAFQDVVLSEVLEHLETPRETLLKIRDIMAPGGRLFLNVPCNSLAPDHIYLFDNPEAIFNLATTAGFVLEENRIYPTTNYSEERVRKAKITSSCAAITHKPA